MLRLERRTADQPHDRRAGHVPGRRGGRAGGPGTVRPGPDRRRRGGLFHRRRRRRGPGLERRGAAERDGEPSLRGVPRRVRAPAARHGHGRARLGPRDGNRPARRLESRARHRHSRLLPRQLHRPHVPRQRLRASGRGARGQRRHRPPGGLPRPPAGATDATVIPAGQPKKASMA